jgi:glycosyl transferase family WecB/TagA/CpsF
MYRNAQLLSPAVLIGVGAAFDFHAGTKRRAPDWMQRAGPEWAHRVASEPKRLAGQYVRTNSEFVVRGAPELIARKSAARKQFVAVLQVGSKLDGTGKHVSRLFRELIRRRSFASRAKS